MAEILYKVTYDRHDKNFKTVIVNEVQIEDIRKRVRVVKIEEATKGSEKSYILM